MASTSGLADPITLSGLNFGPGGLSGMGQPGSGGMSGLAGGESPGMQGGPGLDILSLLNMLTQGGGAAAGVGADQGVINTSPLTSPISGTLSQPSSLQYGIAGNTGAGGMTGFSGQQTGTTGGTGGGTADPLSTLMKLLGLGSQVSGIAAQLQQAGGISPASTGGPQISAQTGTASPTIGGAEQTLTPTDNPFQNFLNMFPQGPGGTLPGGTLPFDAQMGNPAFGPEQMQQLEDFGPLLQQAMTQGSFGSEEAGGQVDFGALGSILRGLQGGVGFGKAVQEGNPLGATQNSLQVAQQLAALLGRPEAQSLLSTLLPQGLSEGLGNLGPLLGGLGSGLGALGGGLGLASGIQSGDVGQSVLGGYGLASGLAGAAGTGALGAGAASVASEAAPALGALALPAAVVGMMMANEASQNANKVQAALHDTSNIRRDMGTAWPQLQGGAQAYQRLQQVKSLPPDQQVPALQQILQQAKQALGAGATVSQFISTQGGRHSKMEGGPAVAPVDVSRFERQTGPLVVQAQLARYAAEDALRARGVDPGQWFNTSPEADVRGLARMAGVPYNLGETGIAGQYTDPWGQIIDIQRPVGQPYSVDRLTGADPNAALTNYNLSPADIAGLQAGPNRLKNLFDFYARLSPGFAQSLVGQFAGGVPDLFQGLSPEAMNANAAPIDALVAQRRAQTLADQATQWNPWSQAIPDLLSGEATASANPAL